MKYRFRFIVRQAAKTCLIFTMMFLLSLLFLLPYKNMAQSSGKTFIVNVAGDEEDFDAGSFPNDDVCDVDAATPGNQCTFRAALQNHNNNRNLDLNHIEFDIANAPGTGSIVIMIGSAGLGPLPSVLGAVTINGSNNSDGRRVELDGSQAGASAIGLKLLGGDCRISFLTIHSFSSHGVYISGTPFGDGRHQLQSNRIGTDATGSIDKGNGEDGIFIDNTPGNIIGSPQTLSGNIISANKGYAIRILGRDESETGEPNRAINNVITGNSIGMDFSGNNILPNAKGGIINENAPNNTIGGPSEKEGNKLAGVKNGISVVGSFSKGVKVEGNFVGQDGSTAKFSAGIFTRSGEQLSIQGNILTDIDSVGLDIYLDANGNYNILKNELTGKIKTGAKFTFGPGRIIDVNYLNNIHFGNDLGLQIEESLNSTINWMLAGDSITDGQTGGNLVFRAAGTKNLNNNHWAANAGIGLMYRAELSENVSAKIMINGDVYTRNGGEGLFGNVKLGASADLGFSILNISSSYNRKDALFLGLGAEFGANSDIIIGGGSEFSFNAGLAARLIGEKTSIDFFKVTLEKSSAHDNVEGAFYLFDIKLNHSVTGNTITGNGGTGIRLGGSSEARIDSNNISGNTVAILTEDASKASLTNNIITGNGKGIVINGAAAGSILTGNSIFGNTGLGIDLGNDGVTPNDPGDADTGPNGLQNYPVITSAHTGAGGITVNGTFNSNPNAMYRIAFFFATECSVTGFGEGESFIGAVDITTDTNGNATFSATFVVPDLPVDAVITAIATGADNSSSEFSACRAVDSDLLHADLALTQQSNKTQLNVGEEIVFTATLLNNGPENTTDITVIDILPAGFAFKTAATSLGVYNQETGTWFVAGLNNAETAVLTVTATAVQAGNFTKTTEITGSSIVDPDTNNNKSMVSISIVQDADVAAQINQLRQHVAELTSSGELPPWQGRILTSVLDFASRFNTKGYDAVTVNALKLFIHLVRNFTLRPSLTAAQAKQLINEAEEIIQLIKEGRSPKSNEPKKSSRSGAPLTEANSDSNDERVEFKGNYPNPFNVSTSISFTLDRSQKVSLSVFASNGKPVATLLNTTMMKGSHTIVWSPTSLPAGVYILQLKTASGVYTCRTIYAK